MSDRFVLVAWPPTVEMLARVLPRTETLYDEPSLALAEQVITMIETSPLSRHRFDAAKHVACDLIRDYRAMVRASPVAADDPAMVERVRNALCPFRREFPGACLDDRSRYTSCRQGRMGIVSCEEIAAKILALFSPPKE